MEAVVREPGAGGRHVMGPSEVVIKTTGADTAGSFFLAEAVIAPGFAGLPPHRHERLHDGFYVLPGTLTIRVGDGTLAAGPGTFVCVPPGSSTRSATRATSRCASSTSTPSRAGSSTCVISPRRRARGHSPPRRSGAVASRHDFEIA